MTLENQIRGLEQDLIVLAEIKATKEQIDSKMSEMMTVTKKFLGLTNEYKEDNKEQSPDLNWGRKD